MMIYLESWATEQNKELKEYEKKLKTEYKEAYTHLLRKKKNNENELIVTKGKKLNLREKPKSRTKEQAKSLTCFNNKLTKLGKKLVDNVLRKSTHHTQI